MEMQKLRGWLPFGRPSTVDEVEILTAWRSPLAGLDPVAAAEELRRLLTSQQNPKINPHARLKSLEACHEQSVKVLPQIEDAVSRAGLPLPGDVLQAALAADNLLKAMAAGYAGLIETLRAQKVPASASHLIRIATLRAIQCLARRQELACRAYAPASANTWQQLHATYAYARQQDLTGFSSGGKTLEQEYISAVLLAFADPTKFSRHDLVPLFECAAHFAPLVIVHDGTTVSDDTIQLAQFLVLPNDTNAGKRLTGTANTERQHGWVIDCSHLIVALSAVLAHRHQGLPPTRSDPGTATAMLRAVLNMWRGQRARRFSRQSFKPRGELVTGLLPLIEALSTDNVSEGSEWTILDESPDGFGLRYIRGNAVDLQVGELVGLRPRERERLHVCLIRRVVNGGAARLELGLQEIAPIAVPLALPGLQRGVSTPAIFFPTMPAHRGRPGALASTGDLVIGTRLNIPGQPSRRALQVLETYIGCELWELTEQ